MSYVSEAFEKQQETFKFLQRIYQDTGSLRPTMTRTPVLVAERNQWLTDLYCLKRAIPFYWNRRTTELVSQAKDVFNLDEILVTRHLPYCDCGWMYFADVPPFSIRMPETKKLNPVRAITWYVFAYKQIGPLEVEMTSDPEAPLKNPFLGLTAWTSSTEKDGFKELMPTLWACTDVGQKLSSQIEGDRLNFTGTYDSTTDQEIAWMKQFFAAASVFLRQEFITLTPASVERHARKRLERAGVVTFPPIQVVQLRKTHPRRPYETPEQYEARSLEHDFQWTVRGHVRQQWYPSLQEHLPIYIHPHIKGPEGKPLKPRAEKIFAVVR
jgi:hypothetical protein